MGKGQTRINYGGQRRTLMLPCGKQMAGHPTEVDKRYKLHTRVCDQCRATGTELGEWGSAGLNARDGCSGNHLQKGFKVGISSTDTDNGEVIKTKVEIPRGAFGDAKWCGKLPPTDDLDALVAFIND